MVRKHIAGHCYARGGVVKRWSAVRLLVGWGRSRFAESRWLLHHSANIYFFYHQQIPPGERSPPGRLPLLLISWHRSDYGCGVRLESPNPEQIQVQSDCSCLLSIMGHNIQRLDLLELQCSGFKELKTPNYYFSRHQWRAGPLVIPLS